MGKPPFQRKINLDHPKKMNAAVIGEEIKVKGEYMSIRETPLVKYFRVSTGQARIISMEMVWRWLHQCATAEAILTLSVQRIYRASRLLLSVACAKC